MTKSHHRRQPGSRQTALGLLLGFVLSACQPDAGDQATPSADTDTDAAVELPATSAGKLAAPITLAYEVNGSPVVGAPIALTITVSTPLVDSPVTLHTRMSEAGSMTFPAAQPESTLLPPIDGRSERRQQLTLTPQREGRLFLVVSAEVETSSGTMMKSLSVPIQVGRSAGALQTQDVLVEGNDGETGISLPANAPR